MKIKEELKNLQQRDLYSILLFVLYRSTQLPEFSSLSELSYILDQKNLLLLCEYFGGTTIRIPTIQELEKLIYSMQMYQFLEIDHLPLEEVRERLKNDSFSFLEIQNSYNDLVRVLQGYEFNFFGEER